MTIEQAKNLKPNDLFISPTGVTLQVINVTKTRIVYINPNNSNGKRVMGFKQFFYWFCK